MTRRRKLSTLFALAFFMVAQFAIVSHMAEGDHAEHSHAGQPCQICVFSDNTTVDTPQVAPLAISSAYGTITYSLPNNQIVTAKLYESSLARAPPYTS